MTPAEDTYAVSSTDGRYFRFKLDLVEAGKPFTLDFVGGCGIKTTSYSFGGTSKDIVASTAMAFVGATPDGHAVGVQTHDEEGVNVCYGDTTANGRIARNWLPLIVWFDRPDELARGFAYATQDAYENPNARIGFRSAVVESATADDYERFLRDGPRNLLPPHQTGWFINSGPPLAPNGQIPPDLIARPSTAWRNTPGRRCLAVARVPLTDAEREQVRQFWPADRPRFWIPENPQDWDTLRQAIPNRDTVRQRQRLYYASRSERDQHPSLPVLPVSADVALSRLNKDTHADGKAYNDIAIGDGKQELGFYECNATTHRVLEAAVTGRSFSLEDVRDKTYCRVDGVVMRIPITDCFRAPRWVVFESDTHAIYAMPSRHF